MLALPPNVRKCTNTHSHAHIHTHTNALHPKVRAHVQSKYTHTYVRTYIHTYMLSDRKGWAMQLGKSEKFSITPVIQKKGECMYMYI
jgi:hypothetical protein